MLLPIPVVPVCSLLLLADTLVSPSPSQITIVWQSQSRQVYMELRGMVDAAAEIKKLEKQLGQVETRVASLQKQMAMPGYEQKVRT